MGKPKKIKAAVYARSATSQNQVDEQVNLLVNLLTYKYKFSNRQIKVFSEVGSGSSINTQLHKALEYCRKNNIDYLAVYDISRLGRDMTRSFEVMNTLATSCDTTLLTLHESKPLILWE